MPTKESKKSLRKKREYLLKKKFLILWSKGYSREKIHSELEDQFFIGTRQQQRILKNTKKLVQQGMEALNKKYRIKL